MKSDKSTADKPTATRSSACPTDSQLQRYRTGALSAEDLAVVERHIEQCPACLDAVDDDPQSDPMIDALTSLPCTPEDEAEYQRLYHALLTDSAPVSHVDLAPTVTRPGDSASVTKADDESFPDQLGVYRLTASIGRGAFGAVFLARHEKLDRTVVIKILRPPQGKADRSLERFLVEMRAVGKLDHPNIIRATDADEADGYHYLVMEHVPGIDVGKLVRSSGQLSVPNACEIVRQTAVALAFADQHQMVHRDIKPSNLLVTWNGVVKMLDLGLVATRRDDDEGPAERNLPHGTADYMSPEQWTTYDSVDIRADLYSLGCTLYRLLAGFPPFHTAGPDMVAKRHAHLHSVPVPLRVVRPEVPVRLSELVDRLLAKSKEQRIQTPTELALSLATWCVGANLSELVVGAGVVAPAVASDGQSTLPSGSFPSPRLRVSRRRLLQGAALLLPVAAAGLYRWQTGRRPSPHLVTTRWRELPLGTDGQRALLALSDDSHWDQTDSTLLATASAPTLWQIGTPLKGRFQLRCEVAERTERTSAGFFLTYQRWLEQDDVKHKFVTIEWSSSGAEQAASESSGHSTLQWKHYVITERDGSADVKLDEWASVDLPPALAGDDAFQTLQIACGSSGIPEVMWNGQSLFDLPWRVSISGRVMTQRPMERLGDAFLGPLGLAVTAGTAEFRSPQLKYESE